MDSNFFVLSQRIGLGKIVTTDWFLPRKL